MNNQQYQHILTNLELVKLSINTMHQEVKYMKSVLEKFNRDDRKDDLDSIHNHLHKII